MTAHKAWAAALVGFVGPCLTYLATWLASTDPWDWRPFLSAVIGSAITSLAAGGGTYVIPNRPKHLGEHTAAGVAHSQSLEG